MLFTIANLLASGVADKKGALACLFIAADGTTFATDRRSLVAVEPCDVPSGQFQAAGVKPVKVREDGVAVPIETVKEVVSDLPKKPLRSVHKTAALTRCDREVEFATTSDGVSAKKNSVIRARTALPDIRGFFQGSIGEGVKVCVSLGRLKSIVDTLDKMCGSDKQQPVYIEFAADGLPLYLRTQSYLTGQRLLAACTTVEAESWLKLNKWERNLLGQGAKVKKTAVKKTPKGKKKVASRRRHRTVEL